jgi:hypothetical protein
MVKEMSLAVIMKLLLSMFSLLGFGRINSQVNKDSLYVFVGEKIDIVNFQLKVEEGFVDIIGYTGTKARYKILQNIFGNYEKDTIEFETYMHMEAPAFLPYKTVLLFVSNYNGKLIYDRGSFFDLYKTVDGRWASPKVVSHYNPNHWKNVEIQNLHFADSLWHEITYYDKKFAPPLFALPIRNETKKTVVVKAAYVEDLLRAKIGAYQRP